MPSPTGALPIAPLERELSLLAAGHLVVGAGGLAAALAVIDGPARALALFAVAAAVVGAASVLRAGWIVEEEPRAADPSAMREMAGDTRRRVAVVVAPGIILAAAALLVGGGLAALVAGVLAGTGAGEARALRLARARAGALGDELWRELGRHPFAGPRRPLYTVPRRASTLRT